MAVRPDKFTRSVLPSLGREPQDVRDRMEALEKLLERMVVIPGINRPVGLDVLLDFIPGVGPTVAAGLGAYLAWEAKNLGMSKWQLARMGGNIGVDWLLGLIPLVGAVPDFFFRSNTRNLRIIKRHLDKHHPSTRTIDAASQGPGSYRSLSASGAPDERSGSQSLPTFVRPVLLTVGVAALLTGLLWIGQGAGLIHWPESSFMLDQRPWITRGGLLAAVGLAVLLAARRR